MLWPDSASRTASCLNSSVYLPRFPFLIFRPFRYYSTLLRDTFCAGKVIGPRNYWFTDKPPATMPNEFIGLLASFGQATLFFEFGFFWRVSRALELYAVAVRVSHWHHPHTVP